MGGSAVSARSAEGQASVGMGGGAADARNVEGQASVSMGGTNNPAVNWYALQKVAAGASAQYNGNGETHLARLKHVRCARVAAERS